MPEKPGFPFDTEEARLDAELTRQELAETAQELTRKVKGTTERVAIGAGAVIVLGAIAIVIRKLVRA